MNKNAPHMKINPRHSASLVTVIGILKFVITEFTSISNLVSFSVHDGGQEILGLVTFSDETTE